MGITEKVRDWYGRKQAEARLEVNRDIVDRFLDETFDLPELGASHKMIESR